MGCIWAFEIIVREEKRGHLQAGVFLQAWVDGKEGVIGKGKQMSPWVGS